MNYKSMWRCQTTGGGRCWGREGGREGGGGGGEGATQQLHGHQSHKNLRYNDHDVVMTFMNPKVATQRITTLLV